MVVFAPRRADGGQIGQALRFERRSAAAGWRGVHLELDDVLAAEAGNQLARRAQRNHLAMVDDGHAVAKPFGLVHVVSSEQDGASLIAEIADNVPHLPSGL